ncbi:uncharacterized protein LOC124827670, partial [Vigna umbellata]|uniref:uncharacterized protein LOC124827670 n=1 Tax=Vigna umbellata TaxID=87088 RepID=UPI001F5F6A02
SDRPDKGKGVARPRKRQRQAPKYVLRVPARLPTTAAGSTSSVGPPPTPIVQPPTPAVDPTPTPAVHPSATPATDPLPPPIIITPTPPPVVITPTPVSDPTSIPSSSVIPPFDTVTPSSDQDSSGDGEVLDPLLHDRPWIELFIPSRMKVQWKSEHEIQIHRYFHMKASHRFSDMFRDALNAGQRPYWLGEQIWNSLLAHWNTVEFRNKCAKAQRNRASERGDTLHTGGLITIHEHAIHMAQALGRAVHVDEVFAQTHEEFSTRLSQVRSEHESALTPDDASNAEDDIRRTQCWIDVVASRGGTLKHQPSSSTSTPNEVVLRLTQALQQRDQEITDLRAEFTNFKALVMRVLPGTSQDEFVIPPTQPQPSSSPAVPQQPSSVQPSSVQPNSVQPTAVQPSIPEQDDEDHSDDNYV